MITIRLLGGARKAIGQPAVNLDRSSASISDILDFLTTISKVPHLLQRNNLIVTLNGIDSASLQGHDTLARTGDTVTIVTVVHGGTDYSVDGNHVSITGVKKIIQDPGNLVDILRSQDSNILIQAINSDAGYGEEHILGALRIALEAEKRRIMITNKRETELLVRLTATDQIAEAMRRAGLKKNASGCFIAFSEKSESLLQFKSQISCQFELDDSVLHPSEEKKSRLADILGLSPRSDHNEFILYLLEKSAILTK